MFSVCRKLQAGHNVSFCQLREIVDNFSRGHADRQPAQDIVDCNSHLPDARLAATLVRLNCNDVAIAHDVDQTTSYTYLSLKQANTLLQRTSDTAHKRVVFCNKNSERLQISMRHRCYLRLARHVGLGLLLWRQVTQGNILPQFAAIGADNLAGERLRVDHLLGVHVVSGVDGAGTV